MHVYAWMVFPLLISRILLLMCYTLPWNQPCIQGNLCDHEQSRKRTNNRTKKHFNRDDVKLINVDHVISNAKLSHVGFWHGKVMRKSEWKDIVNWRMRRLSNCTKSLLHAWTTITSRKKNWIRSEKCPKYDHKLSWNACIWKDLIDLTFFGS